MASAGISSSLRRRSRFNIDADEIKQIVQKKSQNLRCILSGLESSSGDIWPYLSSILKTGSGGGAVGVGSGSGS